MKRSMKNVRFHSVANQILVLHKDWEAEFSDYLDEHKQRGRKRKRGAPAKKVNVMLSTGKLIQGFDPCSSPPCSLGLEGEKWSQRNGVVLQTETITGRGTGLSVMIEINDGRPRFDMIMNRGNDYVVGDRVAVKKKSVTPVKMGFTIDEIEACRVCNW